MIDENDVAAYATNAHPDEGEPEGVVDIGGGWSRVTMAGSKRRVDVDRNTGGVRAHDFGAVDALAILTADPAGFDTAPVIAAMRARFTIASDAEAEKRALALVEAILQRL